MIDTWLRSTSAFSATSFLICSNNCSFESDPYRNLPAPAPLDCLLSSSTFTNKVISSLLAALAVTAPSVRVTNAGMLSSGMVGVSDYSRALPTEVGCLSVVTRKVSSVLPFNKIVQSTITLQVAICLPVAVTKCSLQTGQVLAVTEFLSQFFPSIIPRVMQPATSRMIPVMRNAHCILFSLFLQHIFWLSFSVVFDPQGVAAPSY